MSKILKNTTVSDITIAGQLIEAAGEYTIQLVEDKNFAANDDLITHIGSGDIIVNDGTVDLSVSQATMHIQNTFPSSVSLTQVDPDTNSVSFSPRLAIPGWAEQMFELEMETSKLNSIHEKDIDDNDIGWASVKFYKDVAGTETEWTPADQADLDTNCIRTDLLWMPNIDYQLKGGWVSQKTTPSGDVYVWAVGADLDAAYGGPQITFLEGGLNLAFAAALTLMGLDGAAATKLEYSHPQLGDGKGTNRVRFVFRHPAGFKHRVQCVFDIFRA